MIRYQRSHWVSKKINLGIDEWLFAKNHLDPDKDNIYLNYLSKDTYSLSRIYLDNVRDKNLKHLPHTRGVLNITSFGFLTKNRIKFGKIFLLVTEH